MKNRPTKAKFLWERFEKMPIVGIVRGISPDDFKQILPIFADSGLTTIEITMNTADVETLIAYAIEKYGGQLNIGAGTVCSSSDLENALSYGAQFIVTPIINQEVIKACVDKNIPIFPGALTPSEIFMATNLGADMVKVFPAGYMGADYIREIKGPLSNIRLLPTGGIKLDNLKDFWKAGVQGFGIGSPLFDKGLIQNKDWNGLKNHFSEYVQLLHDLKNS